MVATIGIFVDGFISPVLVFSRGNYSFREFRLSSIAKYVKRACIPPFYRAAFLPIHERASFGPLRDLFARVCVRVCVARHNQCL